MAQSFTHIAMARRIYEAQLFKDPNVVGLGSGYKTRGGYTTDEPALLIYVISKIPAPKLPASRWLPPKLVVYNPLTGRDQEIITDVVETGPVFALSYTGRYRPAPGGVSIGHCAATAGTLGGCVLDRRTGELLILSNNHILANQNNCREGDLILQQGPLDGGTEQDVIATLLRWVPLDFTPSGNNIVDAAVARPLDHSLVDLAILGLGPGPSAATAAKIGMSVQKCGRTTERTTGATITCVDASFWVDYGYAGTRRACFRDVLVIQGPERFSQPGDSGSFIVTDGADPEVTGLLFAANASGTFSLANHIQHIFNLLDVGLVCAPSQVVQETPWQNRLDDLRTLRDQVLGRLQEGQKYLLLLERHNAEIWRILAGHPDLRRTAADLAIPFLDALCASDHPQDRVFSRAYFDEMRALLDRMQPLAGLSLQKTISWLRGELWRYEDRTILQILMELKNPSLPTPQAARMARALAR